jgi:(2R)-3-sulfolactate dehydrogenase (NADP+)
VIGAQFGFEASSFFVDEGNAPRLGQAFLVIDPGALAGSDAYYDRIEILIAEMLSDDGVRLAGARRSSLEQQANQLGLTIPDALKNQLEVLAA